MTNGRRLTRSRNKMIAGVCAGIAEYFGWEVTLFRVVFVIVSILSVAFPGILVYLVLWAGFRACHRRGAMRPARCVKGRRRWQYVGSVLNGSLSPRGESRRRRTISVRLCGQLVPEQARFLREPRRAGR